MQMGPGAAAGAPDRRDPLAALDALAALHVDRVAVAVDRLQAEAVIDLEVGQISEPIVTDQSVLLLMACQRDEADSVMPDRDEIAESISRQRLDLLARDYLRDLRQSAFLDVRV